MDGRAVSQVSRTYVTDLVLRLLHSLHLRSVGHHAETFPLVLFKLLLIERLQICDSAGFKQNSSAPNDGVVSSEMSSTRTFNKSQEMIWLQWLFVEFAHRFGPRGGKQQHSTKLKIFTLK